MSATYQTIRDMQDEFLANSKTGSFSETERLRSINQSYFEVLRYANWGQLKTSANITFTSGVGSLPNNFEKDLELYLEGSNSSISTLYQKLDTIQFLDQISKSYAIVSGSIKIYEADTTTLKLWYIKKPLTNSSDVYISEFSTGTDKTGLDIEFNEPIAMISACRLIRNKNKTNNDFIVLKKEAMNILSDLFKKYSQIYGEYAPRFKSKYERYQFFA